jgi:hypothetical protein
MLIQSVRAGSELFPRQLAKGMLETQIEKDALLATAGANADWYADTRYDL